MGSLSSEHSRHRGLARFVFHRRATTLRSQMTGELAKDANPTDKEPQQKTEQFGLIIYTNEALLFLMNLLFRSQK